MRGLMEEALRIRLKHVLRDVDRYGNVRFYFRLRKGLPKIRLPDDDQSPEFLRRYHALRSGDAAHGPAAGCPHRPAAGSLRWLVVEYMQAAPYRQLARKTASTRRNLLEKMLQEPVRPGAVDTYADMPLGQVTLKALKVLRDRRADMPDMANQRVKALRHVFRWAVEAEHVETDPTRDLGKLKHKSVGWHTWTVEEVERFRQRWPLGTREHLALSLLLWTGARRQDVVLLGRQHVRAGWLAFTTSKNQTRVEIPMLPCLQRVIDASPTGDLTFIAGVRGGRGLNPHAFGNWFREACRAADVPGRAHGLRKAGATTAAENGASPHQLMSIYGWHTLKEAERYTKAAERRKMAGDGMKLLAM